MSGQQPSGEVGARPQDPRLLVFVVCPPLDGQSDNQTHVQERGEVM